MIGGKVLITVIPAYNVQNHIESTIRRIQDYVDFIIVVDDNSKDKTGEIVENLSDGRTILLRNKSNLGVGGATVAGLRKGLELGGEIFVKVDGDDQMDTTRMKDLIAPLLNGYEYAKANRFIHTNELTKMPAIRLVGNFILTFLTKVVSGYWNIFDPQNGYCAITRKALELLPLDKLHKRYFFENDMLIQLNICRARVCDVSIPARYGDEKSSLKIRKILFSFPALFVNRFLNRIYRKYVLYDFSVIGFFYIVGMILMAFGAIFGGFHWIKSLLFGVLATTGTVMVAVLPIILGFQLFLQAMVIEIQEGKSNE